MIYVTLIEKKRKYQCGGFLINVSLDLSFSRCVRYESEMVDGNINVRTELYHQLGTLLKSAIVASRMTPAYRYYVRKQSPDTFIIMYRVRVVQFYISLVAKFKNLRSRLIIKLSSYTLGI